MQLHWESAFSDVGLATRSSQMTLGRTCYYSAPGKGVEYCDEYACLFACLSACVAQEPHVQTLPNFICMLRMPVAQFSSAL